MHADIIQENNLTHIGK